MNAEIKYPKMIEIQSKLISLKADIDDDFRAYEDDTLPGIMVTIGANNEGDWSCQVGDNSFTGAAYGYPHWAVVALYRRSNCYELACEVIDQLEELANDCV